MVVFPIPSDENIRKAQRRIQEDSQEGSGSFPELLKASQKLPRGSGKVPEGSQKLPEGSQKLPEGSFTRRFRKLPRASESFPEDS